ncbi:MAG: hypothetical protein LBV58_03875 [Acholeplasmatales bacterium]|jgi:hypothetical protein|nr:hypothetical protein [Acholeplasmatales bacterium]
MNNKKGSKIVLITSIAFLLVFIFLIGIGENENVIIPIIFIIFFLPVLIFIFIAMRKNTGNEKKPEIFQDEFKVKETKTSFNGVPIYRKVDKYFLILKDNRFKLMANEDGYKILLDVMISDLISIKETYNKKIRITFHQDDTHRDIEVPLLLKEILQEEFSNLYKEFVTNEVTSNIVPEVLESSDIDFVPFEENERIVGRNDINILERNNSTIQMDKSIKLAELNTLFMSGKINVDEYVSLRDKIIADKE